MAAASSTPFFSIRDGQQQQISISNPMATATVNTPQASAPPPVKKKRNLPGTPNPDAEVIALSPKTLMATNRFICEVCNKGFQREQNLQLHRRGHNLPWKLKQKNPKEVRRRVYLCPEPTCVHHDPSRALGDLTGIKKHFCRKHGEKKWKCDKCSKRYAVQSDWKAHSKTCGTREYRCDCGTLFSRRDSFITHRAFCDALAQESARLPTSLTTLGSHLFGNSASAAAAANNNINLGLSSISSHFSTLQDHPHHPSSNLLRLSQFDHLLPPSTSSNPSPFFLGPTPANNHHQEFTNEKPFHGLMHLQHDPSSSPAANNNLFNLSSFNEQSTASLFAGPMMNNDHQLDSLYNAQEPVLPQMSATALLQKAAQMGATTSSNNTHLHDLMNSLANGNAGIFGGSFGSVEESGKFQKAEGLTRDFLGVGTMMRMSQAGSLDSELKSTAAAESGRTFGGASLQ